MECPACSQTLATVKAGDLELDVCNNGCGGIWFDRDELFAFDEQHEFDPQEILKIAQSKESVRIDHSKIKKCPKCDGQQLVRQFFDINNEVEIDQCWECGGVWLDVGEINTIRSQYETHEERTKAANEYLVPLLQQAQEAMDENTKRKLADLNRRYKQNPLARFIGFFQSLTGSEGATDELLKEKVFSADFEQFLDQDE